MDAFMYALALVALPCAAMILLAALALCVQPPPVFVAALQHLAAGIVLSAVAVEPSVLHTACSPARVSKSNPRRSSSCP